MHNYLIETTQRVVIHSSDRQARQDNVLYTSCELVPETDILSKDFQKMLETMYDMMLAYRGVGIAANQCGKPYQVFIMEYDLANSRYTDIASVPKQVFINPVIESVSTERVSLYNGCLSCPGEKRGEVAAYKTIQTRGFNEHGEHVKQTFEGLASIIFQHEFRHLLGGTYMDIAHEFKSDEELLQLHQGQMPPYRDIGTSTDIPVLVPAQYIGQPIESGIFFMVDNSNESSASN